MLSVGNANRDIINLSYTQMILFSIVLVHDHW